MTRRERRDLDVEISFLEGVVARDGKYIEALQILGDDYTQRRKFSSGLKIDKQLARLCPDDPRVLYNLACSHALMHEIEPALNALRRAIAAGYNDFRWLVRDPDLARVRKHPLYKKLEVKIRSAARTTITTS